jgi:hypothetical protein
MPDWPIAKSLSLNATGMAAWEVRGDLPGWREDAVIAVTRLPPLHL